MSKHVKVIGTGSYLPGNPVPFEEINDYLGELNQAPAKLREWAKKTQPLMKEMLGIVYCHYAFNKDTKQFEDDNLSMSVKAARTAIAEAGINAEDIDLLIYGGSYSHQLPPLSTRIQEALGIDICAEFHIHSNCTSVYKGIMLAHNLLKCGKYKNALVVSSTVSSSCFISEFYNQEKLVKEDIFLRWYLSDGAGALVLTACDEKEHGFFLENTYIESAGGKKPSAMHNSYPNYWHNPVDIYENGSHHIKQLFQKELRENAMEANNKTIFYNALKRMLTSQKIDLTNLKYFVVNMPTKSVRSYIIEECKDLDIDPDKVYSAIETMGYAGPPAAIISLDRLLRSGEFDNQDLILSFVMEVSKFMQAGFTIRYLE